MSYLDAGKKVVRPQSDGGTQIADRIIPPRSDEYLSVNFSKFSLKPVCLRGKFNNHFKDNEHFRAVAASILGKTLPMVTAHNFKELCEGGTDGNVIHFHSIDKDHQKIIREILKEYGYNNSAIDQILEGNDLFQFSGITGHTYVTRVVCHKIDNILYLLFLDTNHHIYMNEKYVEESLFYEVCPIFQQNKCKYMPGDCFAFGYLDLKKIQESYGFDFSPK